MSIRRTKRTRAQTEKNTSEANEKTKNRKRRKKIIAKRLQIGTTRTDKTNKTNLYILGDSIVKKLNGDLLTREIKHKYLVRVRSFSGAKISCMADHVKPTLRDMKPDHIFYIQEQTI